MSIGVIPNWNFKMLAAMQIHVQRNWCLKLQCSRFLHLMLNKIPFLSHDFHDQFMKTYDQRMQFHWRTPEHIFLETYIL